MGGMKISELDFIRLLPAFMRDDAAVIALSRAVDKYIGEPGKRLKTIRVWDCIDDLNEAECDELAWELAVDWYDKSYNLKTKRKLIKSSLSVRRIAGTKAAIARVLDAIFPTVKIEEWFEYGGKPYFFRMDVEIPEDGLSARQQASVLAGIEFYKNVRSWLESINYYTESEGVVRTGAYTGISIRVEIWPELVERVEFDSMAGLAGAAESHGHLEIWPELVDRIESITRAGTCGNMIANQRIEIYP